MTANLPMYNLPGLRAANQAFWSALVGLLRVQGHGGLPDEIAPDDWPIPDVLPPRLLFSQMCGHPVLTLYRGQYQLLATPSYAAPGCGPFTHKAFVVVREDDPAQTLADLRGRTFAINGRHSNSGMNLARRLFAPLAREGRFFGEVVETGAHVRSLQQVLDGEADAASIDTVTWAFVGDHQPAALEGLRVFAQTSDTPSIPFITGTATTPELVEALRHALYAIGNEPAYAKVRHGLRLETIGRLPDGAYEAILTHERAAAAAGYSQIG